MSEAHHLDITHSEKKRVWLVTGASRGLGAEIAKAALAAGDLVAATARDPRAITAKLSANDDLFALALDVTNDASVKEAIAKVIERFGRIDVLVNNAGYGIVGAVEETTLDEVRRLYETNVFGLLAVTNAVLPHMRKQRSGHILNLSSVGGFQSGPGFGIYCSTKFAVEGVSEALRGELGPLGISVTAVEPGYFRTEFLEANSVIEMPTVIADYAETSGHVRKVAKQVSLNQPGDPVKLGLALVDLVASKNPPVRLPLGSDTVGAIEAKLAHVAKELAEWRAVAVSTDFPK